jgi:hypoxanthine phosphoribosyltransferase
MVDRIKDLTFSDIKKYSTRLSEIIYNAADCPEHLLFVERAGLFIAYEIADYFDCPLSGIYASRQGSQLKYKLKFILKLFPRRFTHFLRNLEIRSNIHSVKTDRNVYVEFELPPTNKKLLVVDDAIDTGNSMKAVIEYLMSKGYKEELLKTAVLTTTGGNVIVNADYSLFQQKVFAFPWSYDSREYSETWTHYNNVKKRLFG